MTPRPPHLDDRSGVVPRRLNGSRAPTGFRIGPLQVTPALAVLAIAFVGSLAFIAYAILLVEDSAQIPMVTSGAAVLGITFAAVSVGAAIRMWRAWQDRLQGQTVLYAIVGGIAGMIALGCFAGALILGLVMGG